MTNAFRIPHACRVTPAVCVNRPLEYKFRRTVGRNDFSVQFRPYQGSTVGFLLLQHFSVNLRLGTHLVSSPYWLLIYMFIGELELLHADRTTCMFMNHSRIQGECCVHVRCTKLFITDRSKAMLLLWFILIAIVCPLSVSLCSSSTIALWPSAGKEMTSCLSVLLYAVLIVCVPSPLRTWDSIISVPEHCISLSLHIFNPTLYVHFIYPITLLSTQRFISFLTYPTRQVK